MFNAVTDDQTTNSLETDSILTTNDGNGDLNGITKTPLMNFSTSVTPEKYRTAVGKQLLLLLLKMQNCCLKLYLKLTTLYRILTTLCHPHLLAMILQTTTDEEEAAEALLALCNLPDIDDKENGSDDNANLMPIGGPSMSIDVNPVEVKLGADDVN